MEKLRLGIRVFTGGLGTSTQFHKKTNPPCNNRNCLMLFIYPYGCIRGSSLQPFITVLAFGNYENHFIASLQ